MLGYMTAIKNPSNANSAKTFGEIPVEAGLKDHVEGVHLKKFRFNIAPNARKDSSEITGGLALYLSK